jgi:hypothetical protein
MAARMIRGFHLLLAGLFAGMGIGVMIASGAIFQALQKDVGGALSLLDHVFHFIDPLRSAIAMALIASSAALMLRSTRRFGGVRIGLAVLLAGIQGYHVFALRPALDSAGAGLTAPASAAAPVAENRATTPPAALSLQRRSFTLLGLQSLLAAILLVAEPFARMRSERDIAQDWA